MEENLWEPFAKQFLDHVCSGSTLVTSCGHIHVKLLKNVLELCVMATGTTYTSTKPVTWKKAKNSRKDLYGRYVF